MGYVRARMERLGWVLWVVSEDGVGCIGWGVCVWRGGWVVCEVGGRITIYTSHPKVVEEGEGEPF